MMLKLRSGDPVTLNGTAPVNVANKDSLLKQLRCLERKQDDRLWKAPRKNVIAVFTDGITCGYFATNMNIMADPCT